MTRGMAPDAMNARLSSTPYGAWLGAIIKSYDERVLKLEVPWKAEFAGTPGTDIAHGGVLAAVIDTAGSYAIAGALGLPVPTIDMRVDYHRPVVNETMSAEARIIRLGRSLATAEISVFTSGGKLAATGRGLYAVTTLAKA